MTDKYGNDVFTGDRVKIVDNLGRLPAGSIGNYGTIVNFTMPHRDSKYGTRALVRFKALPRPGPRLIPILFAVCSEELVLPVTVVLARRVNYVRQERR